MALQNLEHSQKLWGQRQFDKVRGGLTNFVPMVKNKNWFCYSNSLRRECGRILITSLFIIINIYFSMRCEFFKESFLYKP